MRTVVDPRFHALLSNLMVLRGLNQQALREQVHISKGYMSEIARGHKMPDLAIARALDEALDAGGHLALYANPDVDDDDADRFAALVTNPSRASVADVDGLARTLATQRDLDDHLGSAALVKQTAATMEAISALVREARGEARTAVVRECAEWAQFAGWLHTSTGRWDQARRWFHTAQEWAIEAGDVDLQATVTSYLAHVAWLTVQPAVTVGLSKAALRDERVYVGQRCFDALQLTRGHAACGELPEALSALALGDELVEQSNAYTGPRPGYQYYRSPWFWDLERGLALRYIARHDRRFLPDAVASLERGLSSMPDDMKASDWCAEYMTVGLASAHLDAGDVTSARPVLACARGIAEACRSDRVLALVAGREQRLSLAA